MKHAIIIGAVLLVVVSGSVWLSQSSSKEVTQGVSDSWVREGNQGVATTTDWMTQRGKGSLWSLLDTGKTAECQFVVRPQGVVHEGTAFFDGGRARVDTLLSGVGTATPEAAYVIIDKSTQTVFVWTTASSMAAVQLPLEKVAVATVTVSGVRDFLPLSVDPETEVDYDCRAWRVDASVFVPPADVVFGEVTGG